MESHHRQQISFISSGKGTPPNTAGRNMKRTAKNSSHKQFAVQSGRYAGPAEENPSEWTRTSVRVPILRGQTMYESSDGCAPPSHGMKRDIINIMVQQGLKIIPNAITRVRDIIKVVTSTPSRLQIFNSIVDKSGLKTKSGMNMDVPHRWNATYDMLHEALEYKVALKKYAVEQYHVGPTELEWQKAESLHSFLRAFSEARKAFSTDTI
jgi:hypothetical protein